MRQKKMLVTKNLEENKFGKQQKLGTLTTDKIYSGQPFVIL